MEDKNAFNEAREIAKGTVDGVVGSGIDFVELCTDPDKLVEAVRGAGEAVRTAADYYQHTPPHKVKLDAEDALRLAAAMPAYERGKLAGELAFGALVGEGIGATAKMLKPAESVILRSSSQEFERVMHEISSPQQLQNRLALKPSAKFAAHVDEMVFNLPTHVRDLLDNNGVRILALKDLSQLWPSLAHSTGIFSYGPDNPLAIWLAENAHRADNVLDTRKLELTFRHELAHVTDCFAGKEGWITDSAVVKDMIDREILKLSTLERNDLWRCFSRGSERFLRQEIVAELVARAAVPRRTFRDELFKRCFPITNKFLHAPESPFVFDK